MKLPKQTAPVQRSITGASMSSKNGVEPSVPFWAIPAAISAGKAIYNAVT